jgi:hypothetical protein
LNLQGQESAEIWGLVEEVLQLPKLNIPSGGIRLERELLSLLRNAAKAGFDHQNLGLRIA